MRLASYSDTQEKSDSLLVTLAYITSCLTVSSTNDLSDDDLSVLKEVISSGFYDVTSLAKDIRSIDERAALKVLGLFKEALDELALLIAEGSQKELEDYFTAIQMRRSLLLGVVKSD